MSHLINPHQLQISDLKKIRYLLKSGLNHILKKNIRSSQIAEALAFSLGYNSNIALHQINKENLFIELKNTDLSIKSYKFYKKLFPTWSQEEIKNFQFHNDLYILILPIFFCHPWAMCNFENYHIISSSKKIIDLFPNKVIFNGHQFDWNTKDSMWNGRAFNLLTIIINYNVWLRDYKNIPLSMKNILNSFNIKEFFKIPNKPYFDLLPIELKTDIINYLECLHPDSLEKETNLLKIQLVPFLSQYGRILLKNDLKHIKNIYGLQVSDFLETCLTPIKFKSGLNPFTF